MTVPAPKVDPTSNASNLPTIPHPRWAEGLDNATPESIRNEEENYAEMLRWARDMLKRRWPGSGGLSTATSAGGTIANVAPGVAVFSGRLFNNLDQRVVDWTSYGVALFIVQVNIQPLTLSPGLTSIRVDVDGYDRNGTVTGILNSYPLIHDMSVGDSWPLTFTYPVQPRITGAATDVIGVGIRVNVLPASLQNVTFGYTARIVYSP